MSGWNLGNSYGGLPGSLHHAVMPTPVRAPRLVVMNRPLAESLGLDADGLEKSGVGIFAGNVLPPGAKPLAQAYAGHQYGNFTMLGDGRAILLGEQLTPAGDLLDIQLKGPGRTPFSRGGDGRAALGPMLREYLISEAMHALGIPTTRSLAVAATGEEVPRQEGYLPGAVLARVAASHIRVGTFEYASAMGDLPVLRALAGYTLHRHYPERMQGEDGALALLEGVVERQAALIARWMLVGFVHGVMNTDNMALSGESIDYGPCAFMDTYDPATVFSSIDRRGRYAYANQPSIAQWNLARFAETLLPLLHPDENAAIEIALGAIRGFVEQYQRHWLDGMRRKLGIFNEETDDLALIHEFLGWMQDNRRDFTNSFAALCQDEELSPDDFPSDDRLAAWRDAWRARLGRQPRTLEESRELRAATNPAVIPRNHRVEEALAAAVAGDLDPFGGLLEVLSRPFVHGRVAPEYREPPPPDTGRYVTFCGT